MPTTSTTAAPQRAATSSATAMGTRPETEKNSTDSRRVFWTTKSTRAMPRITPTIKVNQVQLTLVGLRSTADPVGPEVLPLPVLGCSSTTARYPQVRDANAVARSKMLVRSLEAPHRVRVCLPLPARALQPAQGARARPRALVPEDRLCVLRVPSSIHTPFQDRTTWVSLGHRAVRPPTSHPWSFRCLGWNG